jgi:hypothetical protein
VPFAGQGALNLTTLSVWLLRGRVSVEFTRPAKPQDNGAHEQMHRELKAATASPPAPTARAQQRRFERWREEYNEERPHEGINYRKPAQLYRCSPRRWREGLPADYPSAWITRRVRNRGHIKIYGRLRFIGRAFVGQTIGLKPLDGERDEVYLDELHIGTLHRADPGGLRPCTFQTKPCVVTSST